jgi:ankyrin repeat protein/predicted nicotinamide N-methyase
MKKNEEEEEEEEVGGMEEGSASALPGVRIGSGAQGGVRGDDGSEGSSSSSDSRSPSSAVSTSLLDEIRELSWEELQAEWLDAARYDDLTILRAIHHHVTSKEGAAAHTTTTTTTTSAEDGPSATPNQDHPCWMGVSTRDGSGNTALHRAAANGHASVVRWLLKTHDTMWRRQQTHDDNNSRPPSAFMTTSEYVMLPNDSGNTALHWAAANGRADVVKTLLRCGGGNSAATKKEREDPKDGDGDGDGVATAAEGTTTAAAAIDEGGIDVLRRNAFGRSILTEAFQGDNPDVIQYVLEHSSAAEERLLTVGPPGDASKANITKNKDPANATLDREEEKEEPTSNGTNDVREHANEAAGGNISTDDEATTQSIVQDLVFGVKREDDPDRDDADAMIHVRVREVAMATASHQIVADQDDPEHDRTGLSVWSSSIVAAHWMSQVDLEAHLRLDNPESSSSSGGVVVALELGAGCAVPTLVLAKRLARLKRRSESHVYASDWNDEVLDNIRHNLAINELAPDERSSAMPEPNDACGCHAIRMDWNDPSSWEPWSAALSPADQNAKDHPMSPRKPSIIVGADLIYQPSMVEALVQVVVQLLDRDSPHARFYYVAPLTTPRSGGPELIRRLLEEFRLVKSMVAPALMKRNPLRSQDDDECFLHFQELLTSDFRLYEFAWKQR